MQVFVLETQVLKIYGLALPLTRTSLGTEHVLQPPPWQIIWKTRIRRYVMSGNGCALAGGADPAPSLTSPELPLQRQPLHAQYLPFLVSCCRMFLIKWTFLKFFGLGDPESVRHLKNKSVAREGREKKKKFSVPCCTAKKSTQKQEGKTRQMIQVTLC